MQQKQYDYEALIFTYIQSQKRHIHPDFDRYYSALLEKLEDAFGVYLSERIYAASDVPQRAQALWMLFSTAVQSYNSILTPWETFLEAGAMLHRVRQWGDGGQQVFYYSYRISELAKQNRELHLEMIFHIFGMMYGEVDTVITSEDLLAMGFDDTNEPDENDYYGE